MNNNIKSKIQIIFLIDLFIKQWKWKKDSIKDYKNFLDVKDFLLIFPQFNKILKELEWESWFWWLNDEGLKKKLFYENLFWHKKYLDEISSFLLNLNKKILWDKFFYVYQKEDIYKRISISWLSDWFIILLWILLFTIYSISFWLIIFAPILFMSIIIFWFLILFILDKINNFYVGEYINDELLFNLKELIQENKLTIINKNIFTKEVKSLIIFGIATLIFYLLMHYINIFDFFLKSSLLLWLFIFCYFIITKISTNLIYKNIIKKENGLIIDYYNSLREISKIFIKINHKQIFETIKIDWNVEIITNFLIEEELNELNLKLNDLIKNINKNKEKENKGKFKKISNKKRVKNNNNSKEDINILELLDVLKDIKKDVDLNIQIYLEKINKSLNILKNEYNLNIDNKKDLILKLNKVKENILINK